MSARACPAAGSSSASRPRRRAIPRANIIVGNTCLYGAIARRGLFQRRRRRALRGAQFGRRRGRRGGRRPWLRIYDRRHRRRARRGRPQFRRRHVGRHRLCLRSRKARLEALCNRARASSSIPVERCSQAPATRAGSERHRDLTGSARAGRVARRLARRARPLRDGDADRISPRALAALEAGGDDQSRPASSRSSAATARYRPVARAGRRLGGVRRAAAGGESAARPRAAWIAAFPSAIPAARSTI